MPPMLTPLGGVSSDTGEAMDDGVPMGDCPDEAGPGGGNPLTAGLPSLSLELGGTGANPLHAHKGVGWLRSPLACTIAGESPTSSAPTIGWATYGPHQK